MGRDARDRGGTARVRQRDGSVIFVQFGELVIGLLIAGMISFN